MLKMPRGSMVPVIPARETRLEDGGDDVVVSVAPPVPGHLHALDLPTSGIDDEPLTPAAVSRERGAQNAWRRSRWAIHAQVGDEHLAELAARTHQAEALGRVRSKPTACDLGGIKSPASSHACLRARPPRVRPGESEHEDIEAPSRCCLPLGRDGVLHPVKHPVLRGHRLGRVAKQLVLYRYMHPRIQ